MYHSILCLTIRNTLTIYLACIRVPSGVCYFPLHKVYIVSRTTVQIRNGECCPRTVGISCKHLKQKYISCSITLYENANRCKRLWLHLYNLFKKKPPSIRVLRAVLKSAIISINATLSFCQLQLDIHILYFRFNICENISRNIGRRWKEVLHRRTHVQGTWRTTGHTDSNITCTLHYSVICLRQQRAAAAYFPMWRENHVFIQAKRHQNAFHPLYSYSL